MEPKLKIASLKKINLGKNQMATKDRSSYFDCKKTTDPIKKS